MSIPIGEVIAVKGTTITLEVYEESSKETLFFEGDKFRGVSIREHLIIRRGFKDIISLVVGEYLDDRFQEESSGRFVRKVELEPIGYFEKGRFFEGVKSLPMIRDIAYLMKEEEVRNIYSNDEGFVVGKLANDDVRISLPWDKVFNSHVGVFGNTGSGKSNTLTALYSKLFQQKKEAILGKSQFFVVDFNGEYTKDQILPEGDGKKVFRLSTRDDSGDKYPIPSHVFWDLETLAILFRASESTQKPFLEKVLAGRRKHIDNSNSLTNYVKFVIRCSLTSTSQHKEFPNLISKVAEYLGNDLLKFEVGRLAWHGSRSCLYFSGTTIYFNGGSRCANYAQYFSSLVDSLTLPPLNEFEELRLRVELGLIMDLYYNHVQFEFIQPLITRIQNSLNALSRIFIVDSEPGGEILTVVSLRQVNQEMKKLIPLFLAKHLYGSHKDSVISQSPPEKTAHLIIDEAHNILSIQSNRENESWKDYRLELFEEIIKEGRKFGFYLTLSSQRPADISPTIMSQIHNYFIHRLVNDRDLFLLENTISSLDHFSRAMIPNLGKGCAVITGVSFDLPMIVQFDQLDASEKPDSDDVNLKKLWAEVEVEEVAVGVSDD